MSYQHSVVFELSDCGVENKDYYFSDLEDLLIHLDKHRSYHILKRFVEEVRLVGEFSRFTHSKRKDAVRLILKRNEYWIQSEYRLPPVWETFFSDIIAFQQTTPDEIPRYLNQRQKEVQVMALIEADEELASDRRS